MTIEELRKQIDDLDDKIVDLLNQRATWAHKIAHRKRESNTDPFVPARERQVFDNILAHNQGPLPDQAITDIYRVVIAAMRSLEKPLRIVYWGPPGSFTQMAALRKFGSLPQMQAMAQVEDIFAEVEKRAADYGVVPMENSTEGAVRPTLDMFFNSNLRICSEIFLDIEHYLLGHGKAAEIKRVYSNPQVLAQCRGWLRSHLPDAELIEVATSSRGAERAAEEPDGGAIGTALAAELYGLKVVGERIEDLPGNRTRFLVIGHTKGDPSGKDKTSIMFSVPHRPGALHKALGVLEKYDINMTMIEARPGRQQAFEYAFFIDFQGHADDPHVAKAIAQLQETCLFVKVLGSYPEAE
jgi:chorismate mutase/prephenate dehydratase